MNKQGKSAARYRLILCSSSLGCIFALSLFSWPLFAQQLKKLEQEGQGFFNRNRINNRLFQDARRKTVATTQPTRLASNIYQPLARARQALATQARPMSGTVWVSCWSAKTDEIVVLSVNKQLLRVRGANLPVTIKGESATLIVDEPNGVNTKLSVQSTQDWIPLTLAFTIENGAQRFAYYTPAHYQLRSAALVSDGKAYIHDRVVQATTELKAAGYEIMPSMQEMAEKLTVVEHVDHYRFVNEPPIKLFEEIYTLYALNRGETYRYSISSAGAGGMIQMIPSTYRLVRNAFPGARLDESFVTAMADHEQAMRAMLLYLTMTYDFYRKNSTTATALDTIVRLNDLMAAGYNSNPTRIPSYLDRHNVDWTRALPHETNIYLSILHTLENPAEPQIDIARDYMARRLSAYHVAAKTSGSKQYHTKLARTRSNRAKGTKPYATVHKTSRGMYKVSSNRR
ncbi:MAG: hypothetical protein AB1489_19215 [Acidobacteriota bacterium]